MIGAEDNFLPVDVFNEQPCFINQIADVWCLDLLEIVFLSSDEKSKKTAEFRVDLSDPFPGVDCVCFGKLFSSTTENHHDLKFNSQSSQLLNSRLHLQRIHSFVHQVEYNPVSALESKIQKFKVQFS